jgi:hypothetical protein
VTNNIITQEILKVAINKYNATGNIGLLSESSEIGLAICYLYLYTNEKKEKYLSELYELINLQIDNWNRADNSYANLTFGYGLTSLAWTIELILSSTIHIDKIDDWIEDVDAILINQYNLMLQQYNFDYFKGATGLLFYFLTKTKRLDCTELLVDKFLFALDG